MEKLIIKHPKSSLIFTSPSLTVHDDTQEMVASGVRKLAKELKAKGLIINDGYGELKSVIREAKFKRALRVLFDSFYKKLLPLSHTQS